MSPALYLYLPVLLGRAIGKFWCPRLESRYLASQRVQVGCSPIASQCSVTAVTARKGLRHCLSHSPQEPLPVLISPDVPCPVHQLEMAEPAQGQPG